MTTRRLPVYMKPRDWSEAYKTGIPHWAENNQPSVLAKHFLKMLPKKSGNKIFEIGIGNRRDSIFFAKAGNDVDGIDIVRNAVEMAGKNAKTAGLSKKIHFKVGNAEKLQFEDKSFDGVYSVSVLHATDLKLSLKELARVLKNKGKALIYLYEKTEEGGKEYWFMRRNEIEKLLIKNNLHMDSRRSVIHLGHEREETTVLIYKLTKINTK